jgi:hypothetical protein
MAETEISADTDTEISAETDTKTDNFRPLVSTAETNRDRHVEIDLKNCQDQDNIENQDLMVRRQTRLDF